MNSKNYITYPDAFTFLDGTPVNLPQDWNKRKEELLDLYQKNETDLKKYYSYGIVSESEYLAAKNNRQLYEVKTKINQLEFILYNNDIRSKFVDLDDLNDIEK